MAGDIVCEIIVFLALSLVLSIIACLYYVLPGANLYWFIGMFICVWYCASKLLWIRLPLNSIEKKILAVQSTILKTVLPFATKYNIERQFKGFPFFEWWCLGVIMLTTMCCKAYREIVQYFYVDMLMFQDASIWTIYTSLSGAELPFCFDKQVKQNFVDEFPCNATERHCDIYGQAQTDARLQPWMKGLALAAPTVGILAMGIFVIHFGLYVKSWKEAKDKQLAKAQEEDAIVEWELPRGTLVENRITGFNCVVMQYDEAKGRYKVRVNEQGTKEWVNEKDIRESKDTNPWVADFQDELACLVIIMPAAFLALALTSSVNLLMLMTGQRDDTVGYRHTDTVLNTMFSL
jgi:hypothetical protein